MIKTLRRFVLLGILPNIFPSIISRKWFRLKTCVQSLRRIFLHT